MTCQPGSQPLNGVNMMDSSCSFGNIVNCSRVTVSARLVLDGLNASTCARHTTSVRFAWVCGSCKTAGAGAHQLLQAFQLCQALDRFGVHGPVSAGSRLQAQHLQIDEMLDVQTAGSRMQQLACGKKGWLTS